MKQQQQQQQRGRDAFATVLQVTRSLDTLGLQEPRTTGIHLRDSAETLLFHSLSLPVSLLHPSEGGCQSTNTKNYPPPLY